MKSIPTAPTLANWLQRANSPTGVRTIQRHSAVIGTSQGSVREDNQDRAVIAAFAGIEPKESFEFFGVCDGMGGLREGGQCAATALSQVVAHLLRTRREFDRASRLRVAVDLANNAIYEAYRERGGTTIAGILLTRNGGAAVAVGDTRIYLHEGSGEITQLTTDDTIGARVAGIQGEDSEAAQQGPFADHLAQFVGQASPLKAQLIDLRSVFSESDHGPKGRPKGVLVVSDGIHRMAKQMLAAIVRNAASGRDLVSRLMHVSEWIGGHDNASAIYISAGPRTAAERNLEGGSNLSLHDAFGDLVWPIGVPEEVLEAGSNISSDSGRANVVVERAAPIRRLEIFEPKGVHQSKDREIRQVPDRTFAGGRPEEKEASPGRLLGPVRIVEGPRPPVPAGPTGPSDKASDDAARGPATGPKVVAATRAANGTKRGARAAPKGRRKGHKARKTKTKQKGRGDDGNQPEFDILFVDESED